MESKSSFAKGSKLCLAVSGIWPSQIPHEIHRKVGTSIKSPRVLRHLGKSYDGRTGVIAQGQKCLPEKCKVLNLIF